DGTPAEERDQLVLKVDVGRRLVAADVERAHNNRALSEYLEDLAVDANLLVLRRGAGVLEVQELGAQQADALRTEVQRIASRLDIADVRADFHATAILRVRLLLRGSLYFCHPCLLLGLRRLVAGKRLRGRVEHDLAG